MLYATPACFSFFYQSTIIPSLVQNSYIGLLTFCNNKLRIKWCVLQLYQKALSAMFTLLHSSTDQAPL